MDPATWTPVCGVEPFEEEIIVFEVPAGLTPVADAVAARQQELLAPALDLPGHLAGDFLARHGWIVVPVESASHFTEEDAELLAGAMRGVGVTEVLATAAEDLASFPLCVRVPATTQGLLDFSWFTSHFDFALSSPDMQFVVHCTVYDYYLVAGPTKFVRHAVGGDVATARRAFEEFAGDPTGWDGGRLAAVARRYL